ncbi:MAG: hypothetical protein AAF617_07460, partial [Bacteroidota bacterium]
WAGATESQVKFGDVYMLAKNDAQYLYVILDVVDDTHNNPTGDYFHFAFDRNRDKVITPNVDVNYGIYPGHPNKMGRTFYLGAGRTTGLRDEEPRSTCRMHFGASPNSTTPHRIWKMKFKISDIRPPFHFWGLPSHAKFGFKVFSSKPNISYESPKRLHHSFKDFNKIVFAKKPIIPAADLGPVMGSVGLIPTSKINTAGRATTDAGYFVPVKNAAFGGRLNIIGNRTKLQQLRSQGARKYKVYHRFGTSGSFEVFETSWKNYKTVGSRSILETFNADSNGFYPLPSTSADYSIDDLLFQFKSTELITGLHQFKVEFFNNSGTKVGGSSTNQVLRLYIDNNLPEVSINSIKYKNVEVGACGIVNLQNPSDRLDVDFEAFDNEGNLLSYSLRAYWGDGSSRTIASKTYNPTTMGTSWKGSRSIDGSFNAVTTCAHSFDVTAKARTTNGYAYVGRNTARRYVTIIK